MLRLFLLFVLFGALGLSALAYEGATRAKAARDLVAASHAMAGSQHYDQMLTRAAAEVEQSWARPAEWHAGAAEALSAVYALKAEAAGGDRELFARSIDAAKRAVSLAPVQPQTWARLAAFAQMGLPDVPCSVAQCLDMSWRSARMTDPQTACIRLRIAHAEGLLTGPEDPRVVWYVQSGVGPTEIARCLDFMPTEALFRHMLDAR